MTQTKKRIEAGRTRASSSLRDYATRVEGIPRAYGRTIGKQLTAWTEFACDLVEGKLSISDYISGSVALSVSGIQDVIDLGREMYSGYNLCNHGQPGVVTFDLDRDSQSADPMALVGTSATRLTVSQRRILKNTTNPTGPAIDHSKVRISVADADGGRVLVSLVNLGSIIKTLPAGSYRGAIQRNGADVATVRVTLT